MMNVLIDKSTDFFTNRMNCDSDTYDKLKYGISIIYLNLFKTILLFVLAFILGIVNYVLVFLVGYAILRAFASGIHLNNNTLCTIIGITSMLGVVYLSLYVHLNIYIYYLLFVLSFIAYYLYAPAETKKRPIAKRKVWSLKIKSLVSIIFIFLVSYVIEDGVWRNLLTYSVVYEAINILPLTYKLFEGRRDYEKS